MGQLAGDHATHTSKADVPLRPGLDDAPHARPKSPHKDGREMQAEANGLPHAAGGASCSWSGSGAKPSQGIPRASAGNAVSHKHIDAGGLLKARLLSKLYLHVCTYVHVFAEAAPQVRTYVRTYVA